MAPAAGLTGSASSRAAGAEVSAGAASGTKPLLVILNSGEADEGGRTPEALHKALKKGSPGPSFLEPASAALIVGRLADKSLAAGRHPGLVDVLVAAAAIAHDPTMLTANTRHFVALGVETLDPAFARD